jgi:tRNA threonylcarbamoyladenosine biosynthesis protein TsaB
MLILSIDTAMGKESCAIVEDGKVVSISKGTESSLQAERLFEHLDFVLSNNNNKLSDFDYFSINLGPGSFTGIRIGLSAILAMSFALNKKIVGVSSLEASAFKVMNNKKPRISVAIDAGRGEVYYQEFKNHNNFVMEYSNAELVGIEKLIMADVGNLKECAVKFIPDAGDIGICAYNMIINKNADFERKSPIYIRKPDAKVNLNHVQ